MSRRLLYRLLGVGALLVVLALLAAACAGPAPTAPPVSLEAASKQLAFQDAMRKLWEDHVTWTRLYIVSAVHDLPNTDATAQRLLQNQADIGEAIKPFYGDAAGEQLTVLLNDHILIAVDVIAAAKAGDTTNLQDAQARWYSNAEDIAEFLSGANPENWPLDDMNSMMRDHLDLTTEEAVAELSSDWEGSIAAYERVHQQILTMADMLSSGIISQFPEKFA